MDNENHQISRRAFAGAAASFLIVPRHVLGGAGYIAPSEQIKALSWMSGVGYGGPRKSTRPHFREKEIDCAVLASLTHRTLKELAVAAVGHRLYLRHSPKY